MNYFSFILKITFVFAAGGIFLSCSPNSEKDKLRNTDSLTTSSSVNLEADKIYNYPLQLFKIDLLEFKLNKDELPFSFNEAYLKGKKIRRIVMNINLLDGKFTLKSQCTWDINPAGQVTRELKKSGNNKVENSVERNYKDGLLDEISILNPGDKFESSIKKVKYNYSNGHLISVDDILENKDTIRTNFVYLANNKLSEKKTIGKSGLKNASYFSYINGRLNKIEFFNTPEFKEGDKGAIYTYNYTQNGKLLYGDHWYPGISNDSYIFEFDKEDRLVEITYKTFLKKGETKVPEKTKSYRYAYEKDELKKINYFMQATNFTQHGTFEFSYQYY